MSLYLEDIKELKIYRNRFFLPIDRSNRKKGAAVFLLTKSIDDSCNLMTKYPIFINLHTYISYYLERDVTLYLNESVFHINDDLETLQESLSKKERDEIPDDEFGLPEERKFPLDTPEHVKSAIRLFGHCPEEKKPLLAKRIMTAAEKFGIEVKEDTEVWKYAHGGNTSKKKSNSKSQNESAELTTHDQEILNEAAVYETVHEYHPVEKNTGVIREDYIDADVNGMSVRVFFDDSVDNILNESNLRLTSQSYTNKFRRLLYQDRIKNIKEQHDIYDYVKNHTNGLITKTYISYKQYEERNLFIDLSYYMHSFFKNNMYILDIGLNLFMEMLHRGIMDKRLDENGYKTKTVLVPLDQWTTPGVLPWDHTKNINLVSLIYRCIMRKDLTFLQEKLGGIEFVFLTKEAYLKLDLNHMTKELLPKFKNLIFKLYKNDLTDIDASDQDSADAITTLIVHKLSSGGINIDNLTGGTSKLSPEEIEKKIKDSERTGIDKLTIDEKKAAVVQTVKNAAKNSTDIEDTLKNLNTDDNSEWLKGVLDDLQCEDQGIDISKTRKARIDELNDKYLNKTIKGKKIEDYLKNATTKEIPKDNIPVDSIEEAWKDVTFTNFSKSYDLDADVISIINSFINKREPMAILDIDKEDVSTSEDYMDLWTVKLENANGKRFTLKFNVPKFIDGRFMKMRGNLKTIQGQLLLLPIIKTDEDTAQIVSNYNKIFIKRINPSNGTKTTAGMSKLNKILNRVNSKTKYKGDTIKILPGDNSFICKRYELPIEYKDLAGLYSKIVFKDGSMFCFNVDDMKKFLKKNNIKHNEDEIYFYYDAKNKKAVSIDELEADGKKNKIGTPISVFILNTLKEKATEAKDSELITIMDACKPSDKLSYSEASILNTTIPVIVVMAYSEGLQTAMTKANIKYRFSETRPNVEVGMESYVKFKDGYLIYEATTDASLLMNGLSKCDTEFYSIKEINRKNMWLDFLDDFGGRIKADGLDNFYDLMMDPITKEICDIYHLPSDYITALGYASSLLADTKYNRHTDITGNRIRTNEIVAGYVYKALATAYGQYKNTSRRNKKDAEFTIKQTAVLDSVLADPTLSDLSILSPLLEAEAASTVTYKGLSGLNSDRSYTVDKRAFDDSMFGVLSYSTGFAGNVGIFRQTTIDAGVTGTRGIITPKKKKTTLNTLSVSEALTPFSTTHDDPMRIAMGFIQTSKHQMRVQKSSPSLITNGADEALPYITSNFFSYKFKGKRGKIVDITDRFIIYQDLDTKEYGYVDIRENVMKNSDGGFYVTVQLSPNVKKGQMIKFNDILAYDKSSYSKAVGSMPGDTQSISYNIGTLSKVAIFTSADAYNDSTTVTESLSESLATEYCVKKDRYLPKESNVYNVVKPGTKIEEGDPLMVFQNAFEEEDANALLKNLTDDDIELVNDLGRIHVRSKLSGVVQDVKIYRTCEMSALSPSLRKLCTEYEKRIKEDKKLMAKYKIENTSFLEPDYVLENTGKLKVAPDGILIEFYIKAYDKFSVGDKLIQYTALKGVCMNIVPKGKEPYTAFRPHEHIESILACSSVYARMVVSVIITGLINKCMVELDRSCREELGLEWKNLYDMDFRK